MIYMWYIIYDVYTVHGLYPWISLEAPARLTAARAQYCDLAGHPGDRSRGHGAPSNPQGRRQRYVYIYIYITTISNHWLTIINHYWLVVEYDNNHP